MSKQYTFKTTRDTHWLQEVLDVIESPQRSSFIREMIIIGIEESEKGLTYKSHTQVTQRSDMSDETSRRKTDTPVLVDVSKSLEDKLNSLKF